MNDLLMDIISLKNRSASVRLSKKENELFCMACYDLDKFRDVTFEKKLWETTPMGKDKDMVEAIQEDDISMIRFATVWIKQALFGNAFPSRI